MKKILLSSLLAVMAVTSANAKIASTGYVDDVQEKVLGDARQMAQNATAEAFTYTDEKIGTLDATTTGNGAIVKDVTQTDGVVTVTRGNIAYSDLEGIPRVDTAMSDSSTNAVQNKVIKSYVDNAINTVEGEIGEGYQKLDQKLTSIDAEDKVVTPANRDLLYPSFAKAEAMVSNGTKLANTYTDSKIAGLTNEAEVVGTNDGKYVTYVSQSGGKIKASVVSFDGAMDANSTNAVQNKVIKSYVDTEVGKKQSTLTDAQLAAANSGITAAKVTAYDAYDARITQNNDMIVPFASAPVATEGEEDGQYVLTKKVVNNVATYSWELIDRELAN